MTPEQFQVFLKSNEEATAKAIEKYVNGGIRGMKEDLLKHSADDKAFQDRLEPVIKVFEDNKVVKAVLETETKKITFYIREITTIGVFLVGVWGIIKIILNMK